MLLKGEKDLEYRAEFYEPYQPDLTKLGARSLDVAKIAGQNPQAKAALDAFLQQHGGVLTDYLYLPLRGRNKNIVMALSAKKESRLAGFRSTRGWRMAIECGPSLARN